MSITAVAAIAVLGVILSAVLKRYAPMYVLPAEIALVIFVFVLGLSEIKDIAGEAYSLFFDTGVSETGLKTLLKIFGLLCVGTVTSDICRDASEGAVADTVELFTKTAAVLAAFPAFSAVIKIALEFFSGE